jgi:hypothetical protein
MWFAAGFGWFADNIQTLLTSVSFFSSGRVDRVIHRRLDAVLSLLHPHKNRNGARNDAINVNSRQVGWIRFGCGKHRRGTVGSGAHDAYSYDAASSIGNGAHVSGRLEYCGGCGSVST